MALDYSKLSSELEPAVVEDIVREVSARNRGDVKDLNAYATKNEDAIRPEEDIPRASGEFFEQNPFQRDNRRIIFSNNFQRLEGKTQSCSFPDKDHITNRSIHSSRVAQTGRAVARCLGGNEDLAEANGHGHDLGHTPLGHLGEAFMTRAIFDFNAKLMGVLGVFKHNIQGLNVVDRMAYRRGICRSGLNLTHQVRHGIVSHDGEAYVGSVTPSYLSPDQLDADINAYIGRVLKASEGIEFAEKVKDEIALVDEYRQNVLGAVKGATITPATFEAAIIAMVDVLTYGPEDFEDMVSLGLVERHQLPPKIAAKLGTHGADMINRLVTDLVVHSYGQDTVRYSAEMAELVNDFKRNFLYPNYFKINAWSYGSARDARSKMPDGELKRRIDVLFNRYCESLANPLQHKESSIVKGFLDGRDLSGYYEKMPDDEYLVERAVVDYIAGFTDKFFFDESDALLK